MSTRAPSQPSISERPQQRGGIQEHICVLCCSIKGGRRRGRKNEHVPIARKTKLGGGPLKGSFFFEGVQNAAHRRCGTLQTQRSERGGTGQPWISRRSCPDGRALASMRAPSRSGISEGSQQRGGARPGSQAKLPNSRKPSAMKDQVTEASISQSMRGGEERNDVDKSMHK